MQSEEINEIAKALCAAQAVMEKAQVDATNPHFKKKYATLAAVLEAVRKPLTDNGLAVSQMVDCGADGSRVLRTMLLHTSGQWLMGEYPLPPTATAQQMGSALTYARRYSLSAIVCNAVDDDDDGEAAQAARPAPAPAARRSSRTTVVEKPAEDGAKPKTDKMNMQQITEFEQQAKNAAKRGSLAFSQFWRNLSTVQEQNIVKGMSSVLIELRDEADKKLAEAEKKLAEAEAEASHDPETGELPW